MLFASALCLSFVASALAQITITYPSTAGNWTNDGPQNCTWVGAIPNVLNFTVVLVSKDNSVNQVLAAQVDASTDSTVLEPPSAGWPSDPGQYFLEFAQSPQNVTAVLAKSTAFFLAAPPSANSSTVSIPPPTAPIIVTNPLATPTTSSGGASPSNGFGVNNNAAPALNINTGLIAIGAALGFAFA